MRRFSTILAAVLLVGVLGAYAQEQPETIDRIIATVNKQPLLLSDWDSTLHMEAFLQGRDTSSFTAEERKAALKRMIDRELLVQQMQADYSPSTKEISDRVKQVRSQFRGAETEAGWNEILIANGITPDEVNNFIRMQLQVLRFVDLRLRPTVRVDEEAIEAYYRDTFLPELKKAGAAPAELQQVRPKIREILVQQRMDGVLESWLANLRSQSEVHIASDPDVATSRLVPGGGVEAKDKVVQPK